MHAVIVGRRRQAYHMPYASPRMAEGISMTRYLISRKSSKWKHFVIACAVTCLVAVFSPSMPAQEAPRDVTGIVTDQHREPLRRAVVMIDDEETKVVFSYITDLGGKFAFKRLNGSDDYRIWATRKGHRSKATHLSPFDNRQSRPLTLVVRFQSPEP